MSRKVLIMEGDGVGPEIITEARKIVEAVNQRDSLGIEFSEAQLGGSCLLYTSPSPRDS